MHDKKTKTKTIGDANSQNKRIFPRRTTRMEKKKEVDAKLDSKEFHKNED